MKRRLVLFLATGMGVGYAPIAPGTFGTALAALGVWIFGAPWIIIGFIILIGLRVSHQGEIYLGEKDSPRIVLDEIAGFFLAMAGLPLHYLPVAFVLFRALDIIKPPPISWLQRLPGGWGIMLDDLVAGVITNVIIHLYLWNVG